MRSDEWPENRVDHQRAAESERDPNAQYAGVCRQPGFAALQDDGGALADDY